MNEGGEKKEEKEKPKANSGKKATGKKTETKARAPKKGRRCQGGDKEEFSRWHQA